MDWGGNIGMSTWPTLWALLLAASPDARSGYDLVIRDCDALATDQLLAIVAVELGGPVVAGAVRIEVSCVDDQATLSIGPDHRRSLALPDDPSRERLLALAIAELVATHAPTRPAPEREPEPESARPEPEREPGPANARSEPAAARNRSEPATARSDSEPATEPPGPERATTPSGVATASERSELERAADGSEPGAPEDLDRPPAWQWLATLAVRAEQSPVRPALAVGAAAGVRPAPPVYLQADVQAAVSGVPFDGGWILSHSMSLAGFAHLETRAHDRRVALGVGGRAGVVWLHGFPNSVASRGATVVGPWFGPAISVLTDSARAGVGVEIGLNAWPVRGLRGSEEVVSLRSVWVSVGGRFRLGR